VGCAAALATIRHIERDKLVDRARELGEVALDRMNEMARRHRLIGDVRGLGLLMGLELVRDRDTRERATDEADRVMYGALTRGLSFKVSAGNVLTLTPPLTITKAELERALDIVDACLTDVEDSLPRPRTKTG
jgi:4-aminobutyrate aminotransferase